MICVSNFVWLGHVQNLEIGDGRERGKREVDLEKKKGIEVDAEVAPAPGADEGAAHEIADGAVLEIEKDEIAGVGRERESARILRRGVGHVQEMVEDGLERGEEAVQEKGSVQGQRTEREGGPHLEIGSSEGEAIRGRETNVISITRFDTWLLFLNVHNYYYVAIISSLLHNALFHYLHF